MSASAHDNRSLDAVIRVVARSHSRLSVLFPAHGGTTSPKHPPLVTPSHHTHHEIAICYEGEMMLVGEDRIHDLRAGDAVVVTPGAWHYESHLHARRPYRLCWLVAHPGRMGFVFTYYRRGKFDSTHLGTMPTASDRALIDELARELRDQPAHWRIRSHALLTQLLVELDRRLEGATLSPPAEPDPLQKLARITETRFREPLQIKSLSGEVGMSADHLSRRFKAKFGVTFKDYLNSIRIHHAQLLLTSGWSVKRTAAECGFRDVYYFSRVFKQRCKITPGRFVKS